MNQSDPLREAIELFLDFDTHATATARDILWKALAALPSTPAPSLVDAARELLAAVETERLGSLRYVFEDEIDRLRAALVKEDPQ